MGFSGQAFIKVRSPGSTKAQWLCRTQKFRRQEAGKTSADANLLRRFITALPMSAKKFDSVVHVLRGVEASSLSR